MSQLTSSATVDARKICARPAGWRNFPAVTVRA
jgi:hypothetical protein